MATEAEIKKLHATLAAQRITWAKYAAEHDVKGHLPYRYKVNQRCLRTIFHDFGTDKEQRVQLMFPPGALYEIDVPQASAALDPADAFTAEATAKRAKEIELEIAGRAETSPEVQSLRQQLAEQTSASAKLQAQLSELAAVVATLKAAPPAPQGKR